jgi:hypothetical protein
MEITTSITRDSFGSTSQLKHLDSHPSSARMKKFNNFNLMKMNVSALKELKYVPIH